MHVMYVCYVCMFGWGLPQSCSSLASEQSTLPLHRSFDAMQSPVLQLAMSDEFIVYRLSPMMIVMMFVMMLMMSVSCCCCVFGVIKGIEDIHMKDKNVS